MTTSKPARTVLMLTVTAILLVLPSQARADDFVKIVHSIESNYHVHRNHRFLMGFARVVVKVGGGFVGAKGFKMALFEDQHLALNPTSDLDEVVQRADEHGWQPVVKSFTRHGDEHTFIYARDEGKDLRMLVVNVESTEAVVIQVKINPNKLAWFIETTEGGGHRQNRDRPDEYERMAFR